MDTRMPILNVLDFARVNSCSTIKSEVFAREMNKKDDIADEERLIKSIDNNEMKRLFGIE